MLVSALPTNYTLPATAQGQRVAGQPTYVGTAPLAAGQGYTYTTGQNGQLVIATAPPSDGNTTTGTTAPLTPAVMPAGAIGAFATGQALHAAPRALTSLVAAAGTPLTREQVLEHKLRELEQLVGKKDQYIKELQSALAKAGAKVPAAPAAHGLAHGLAPSASMGQKKMAASVSAAAAPVVSARAQPQVRSSGGFRKVQDSKPLNLYQAVDQDDPIDLRLEEFYNSTGSAVPFRRINRGFYRFGDTICELDVINHKLMSRTEDGWNRGKFGPIEKFLMYYENIEREKAGIMPEG